MKKKKLTDSIKFKLILTMLLICAVPLIVSVVMSSVSSTSKAMADAYEMNLSLARVAESQFTSILEQNMRALQTAAESPFVKDYLKASESERDQEKMLSFLSAIDAEFNDGNVAILAGTEGMQLARASGDCVDVTEREYYQTALKGTTYLSDVLISKATGARIIIPIVPIYDYDGKTVIGTIQRDYNLTALHQILDALDEGGQNIFILDRDGVVTAHSSHDIASTDPVDDRSSSNFFNLSKTQDSGSVEYDHNGTKQLLSFQKEGMTNWVVAVARDYDQVMSSATRSAILIMIVGIILVVIACVISIAIANSFAEPILVIDQSMKALADGRFEPIEKYQGRKDEFGDMVKSMNLLIDKLSTIVKEIKQSASAVDHSSTELAETANQISQTADGVSEAVQEIATGATQQADEIQHATENTSIISDNIQDVSENAANLERTTNSMDGNSKDSANQLEKLKTTSDHVSDAIGEISDRIGATSTAVENISSKVEAINSIATQTNLLALNASIEAARAGEAGRGFAVVAEEISHLADSSAQSANEIRAQMNVLLNESQGAVKKAEEVRSAMEEQKAVLDLTVSSIDKLIQDIAFTVGGVGTITNAAEATDASKAVVVDAMSSLSAISEENAAASEETSASMQELNATVNTLAGAADDLKDISNKLMNEISFFKD